MAAAAALDATYRHDARRLPPQESHLVGPGHQLLTTTLGDLDCLTVPCAFFTLNTTEAVMKHGPSSSGALRVTDPEKTAPFAGVRMGGGS